MFAALAETRFAARRQSRTARPTGSQATTNSLSGSNGGHEALPCNGMAHFGNESRDDPADAALIGERPMEDRG